jgi:outer membrane lipoprotein-sorting protein
MFAAPDPGVLLNQVDAASNPAKDATITMALTVTSGTRTRKRQMRIWQFGRDRRMVKFLSPARLRGTGVLVPQRKRVFLYLPAFNRVRRVAAPERSKSFMGTGFTMNDMARVRYAPIYTPSNDGEDAGQWILKLQSKNKSGSSLKTLRIWIRKSDKLVSRVDTVNVSGVVVRTIRFSSFRTAGRYKLAHKIQITESTKDRTTNATVEAVQFDTGLDADFFSDRQLRRAP